MSTDVLFMIAVAILCFTTGMAAVYLITQLLQKRKKRTNKKTEQVETAKKIVWVCLFNGFAWVWCSYILACLDKVQIAESLSQAAVTEIIGVVLAYCLKSLVENLSKHNNWPDKPIRRPKDSEQQGEENGHG